MPTLNCWQRKRKFVLVVTIYSHFTWSKKAPNNNKNRKNYSKMWKKPEDIFSIFDTRSEEVFWRWFFWHLRLQLSVRGYSKMTSPQICPPPSQHLSLILVNQPACSSPKKWKTLLLKSKPNFWISLWEMFRGFS